MEQLGVSFYDFFLPPNAASWFKPTSVELHQIGTFEGCSTNWATAPWPERQPSSGSHRGYSFLPLTVLIEPIFCAAQLSLYSIFYYFFPCSEWDDISVEWQFIMKKVPGGQAQLADALSITPQHLGGYNNNYRLLLIGILLKKKNIPRIDDP